MAGNTERGLAATFLAGVLIGSAFTCGIRDERQRERARTITAEMQKLKACPDRYPASCLSPEEEQKKLKEAQELEGKGRFTDAGRVYIQLGRFGDVKRMIGSCYMTTGCYPSDLKEALEFRARVLGRFEVEKAEAK